MDKIVFIPQPQAQQLCANMLKVMHSKVPMQEYSSIIVYADGLSSKINRSLEEIQEEEIAVMFGNLPYFYPTNAVVGILRLGRQMEREGQDEYAYVVSSGYVFDNPLYMSKETASNLAETDLFFTLPRYSVVGMELSGMFDYLAFYVSREVFFSLTQGKTLKLEINKEVAKQILDEEGNLKNYDTIFIHHGNMMRKFEWNEECFIETEVDEEGNPVCYPTKDPVEGDAPRQRLHILCTYKR
ncbi:MAG: hypothetical protein J5629_07190 [Muribaculaceae bacterium]|nr:hypothetical protein [Muribaculaceae bacterium]